jgi:hypothetical protein
MDQPGRVARLRKGGLPGAEVVTLWRIALRWMGYRTFTAKASALIEFVAPPAQDRLANPADRVTLDDSVSLALLVLLQRLSPAERVVFVPHDIFGPAAVRLG